MQTENLNFFFHLVRDNMSSYKLQSITQSVLRDSLHDHLHYCEILLVRFSIKIVLNIISSLRIVFSLCARFGWCDVCSDFANFIKVDANVDLNGCRY